MIMSASLTRREDVALKPSKHLLANGPLLQALEVATYDIVLMDIHMPEMDGLEASRHICARFPEAERPRIVALSADTLQACLSSTLCFSSIPGQAHAHAASQDQV